MIHCQSVEIVSGVCLYVIDRDMGKWGMIRGQFSIYQDNNRGLIGV